jgi:hypothetical protein
MSDTVLDRGRTARGRWLLAWATLGGAGVLPFAIAAAANSWWTPTETDFIRMMIARAAAVWAVTGSTLLVAWILRRYRPVSRPAGRGLLVGLIVWTYIGWVSVLSGAQASIDGVPVIDPGAAIVAGLAVVGIPFLIVAALLPRGD